MTLFTHFMKFNQRWRQPAIWLLWLLLSTPWLAWGQATSPFVVRLTTNPTTIPNPLPTGSSVTLQAKAVYPPFGIGSGFGGGVVYAVAVQADGKILVGGSFTTSPPPYTQKSYLVRLNIDGSTDGSFTTPTINGPVRSLAVQADGRILMGGSFTNLTTTGISRSYLARLTTDGILDFTFGPTTANGPDGAVTTIALQADGRVLIGGDFNNYDGNAINSLARLTTTGKFNAFTGTVSTNVSISGIAVQADQKIIIAGLFGLSTTFTVRRYNADGSVDNSFSAASLPNEGSIPYGIANVTALAEKNGSILLARKSSGSTPTNNVYLLSTNGTIIRSIAIGLAATDQVNALTFQDDGRPLLGGDFHLGASTTRSYLARLDANGTAFTPDANFTASGGPTGAVWALAVQPNQQVLVGGDFTIYNGSAPIRLARATATGSLNDADVDVLNPTYKWSNGSTGPNLTVNTGGSYSATATANGLSATSNNILINTASPDPNFSVRVTPTGPLSLCPTTPATSRVLTALVVTPTPTVAMSYQWWQVTTTGSTTSATPILLNGTSASYTMPALAAGSTAAYFVTAMATATGARAASPTVSVSAPKAPTISAVTPGSGLPGTNVTIAGDDLNNATGVSFGGTAALFVRVTATANTPAQLVATVPAGASSGVAVMTNCTTVMGTFTVPVPPIINSINGFTPTMGDVGTLVTIGGTGFTGTSTIVTFNGASVMTYGARTATQLVVTVPMGATTGPITVTTPSPAGGSTSTTPFVVTNTANPLLNTTISTGTIGAPTTSTRYSYTNLTIVKPGVFMIDHEISVSGRLEVQDGATLITGPNLLDRVIGAGNFVLGDNATLRVGHPQGISQLADSGAVQVTGPNAFRSFSLAANYYYYSATAPLARTQITGNALPSRVLSLTCATANALKLTSPVAVTQLLTMANGGNLYLNNQALTLLSNAAGTALVVNSGAGQVIGSATVQRYINPVANSGTGFRYYGPPVTGATAAVLAAPVFDFDQNDPSRPFVPPTPQDTLPLISYGFSRVPLASSTFLSVGRGYRATVPAATTVQFTGTLNNGNITLPLARTGNAPYNGWNLVSNPYPAPLNWSKLVAAADTLGLDAAVYVYESTSTATGRYRSYVNNVSNDGLLNHAANGDLLIAMGQAFFVRVRKGRTTGALTFRNAHRATTYADQATFSRLALAAPFELDIELERNGGGGGGGGCTKCHSNANRVAFYVDPAGVTSATQPFNLKLDADAGDLFSFSQQTLSIKGSPTDSSLAIRAIASPAGQIRRFPLILSTDTPGDFVFRAAISQNQPPASGLQFLYLHDTFTNQWVNLLLATPVSPATYSFTLSPAEAFAHSTTRFEVYFAPVPLANTPAQTALSSAVVFPNPARQQVHLWVPAVPAATQVQVALFNSLGQVVYQQTAALPATGTALDLATQHLAGGVYVLRIQASGITTTRRVVLEP